MLNWFRSNRLFHPLVDIHSHLIPGIDDGVKTIDQSMEILNGFEEMGYKKVVTTPHIHPNYPNKEDVILQGLKAVREAAEKNNLTLEIEAAAEYYVDDVFVDKIHSNKPLLAIDDTYVLVESSFLNKPMIFEQAMFDLKSRGYVPLLAHPERYRFLEGSIDWLTELKRMGVCLQVTCSSLVGYYGPEVRKVALNLIRHGMVDFLGSDVHRISQLKPLKDAMRTKEMRKLINEKKLKNNELL